jgi:hypothetical protein
MATRIFKYTLAPVKGEFVVHMPADARILKTANQNETICIWCEVDEEKPMVQMRFILLYTGDEIDTCASHRYIGTVLLRNGQEVVHIYEDYG